VTNWQNNFICVHYIYTILNTKNCLYFYWKNVMKQYIFAPFNLYLSCIGHFNPVILAWAASLQCRSRDEILNHLDLERYLVAEMAYWRPPTVISCGASSHACLLVFHSNCVCFVMFSQMEFANFSNPIPIWRPRWGWFHQKVGAIFDMVIFSSASVPVPVADAVVCLLNVCHFYLELQVVDKRCHWLL